MSHPQFFVSGTDTDVGKTLVSGILTHGLKAFYWKPVQAGVEPTTDSKTLAEYVDPKRVLPERWVLQHPRSPNQAAERDGVELNMSDFKCPEVDGPLIVEGAGGLYVPLNDKDTMLELIQHLALPVILATRTGLGTLNHTLLSIEALKRRNIPIAGVIFNGDEHEDNQRDIAHFGQVPIIGRVPRLATVDPTQFDQIYATFDQSLLK